MIEFGKILSSCHTKIGTQSIFASQLNIAIMIVAVLLIIIYSVVPEKKRHSINFLKIGIYGLCSTVFFIFAHDSAFNRSGEKDVLGGEVVAPIDPAISASDEPQAVVVEAPPPQTNEGLYDE